MWVPKAVLDWFHISKDSVDALREELASIRTERDMLFKELTKSQIMGDWMRMKVNQLEFEKTALMEKAYGIKIPAPEIARQPTPDPTFDPKNFSFEDVGESLARTLGLPKYDEQ